MTDTRTKPYPSIARWLAVAAVALIAAACTRELPVEEVLKQSRAAHAKGELQAVIIQIKNVLLKEPNNAEARYLLGLAYLEAGDARSAEKELQFAKKLGVVEGGRLDSALGQALAADRRYQEVIDQIKPLPAFDAEGTAGVHAARGSAYLGLGNFDEAKKAFAEARKANEDHPEAMLGLARIAFIENRPADGTALMNQILAKYPKHFEAWMLKGDVLRGENKTEEAIAAYGSALKSRPTNLIARISRAAAYVSTGKYREAQADIDAARKVAPRHYLVHYTQAFIHFRNSKFQDAQSAIQLALQASPDNGPSLLLAGAIHYALGSFAQAEVQLSRVLAANPNNQTARKLLAASLVELKRGKEALEVIGPLAQKEAQDWVVYAVAGGASMRAGDYEKAADMLEKAVKEQPKRGDLRTDLGMSYLAKGDVDRAIATLEEATELSSTLGQANTILIITHIRKREYDKALEALNRFETKDPKAPVVHHLRGLVLEAKGDTDAARKSFQKVLSMQPTYMPSAVALAGIHLKDKDLAGARKVYEDVLSKDKDNLLALLALAKLQAIGKNHEAAVALLERARQAHPSAVAPRIELGTYLLKIGQAQKAAVVGLEAQKIAPTDPAVLELVASAQLGTGETSSAIVSYTSLARQQPSSVIAQSGLGFAHMRLSKYAEAADYFRNALQLKPNDYSLLVALAESQRSAKQYEEALKTARTMRRVEPGQPGGATLEGDILLDQGKPVDALKSYEQAFAINKSGTLVVRAYRAQFLTGDRDGARARLENWIKENPTDVEARAALGEAMLGVRNYRAAAEHYQVLVKRSPENALYLNNLAAALHELKDPRSVEYAGKALKLAPRNPFIMDTYGWALVAQDKPKEALPYLDEAVTKLADDVPEVRYHLGVALARAGEKVRAKRELERALASGKRFAGSDDAKALLSKL